MLALVFAAFALLLLAAVLFLATPPGGRWLAGQVVGQVNATIAGSLSMDRLHVRGLSRVVAHDAKLHGPDGAVVAHAERVEADVELRSLRDRTVIERLLVE
ncbi:MAG: hypothetical protein ACK4N5_10010, partial [Myxococcales bacterium]